jgi:lactoylglutathione lyase
MQIEHVAIWTRDLKRLIAFYQTYFEACPGRPYVNQRNRFESCFLEFASGARLELMSMPTVPDSTNDIERQFTGIIHLAFAAGSEENVERLTRRLERDGYRVVDGPRRTGDGYYESVVFDPDGNRLEITV